MFSEEPQDIFTYILHSCFTSRELSAIYNFYSSSDNGSEVILKDMGLS